MRYREIIPTALLVLGLAAQSAPAAVWYVAKYAPGPAHDGKTWATAMTAIQQAVSASAPGDEVWVGYGSYSETLTLKPNVSLYGGFVGYELFRDQRLGIQGLTTILLKPGVSGAAVGASGSGFKPATVFDGFTLSGSSGGLNCVNASLTISHNVFVGNNVAVSVQGGSPVIADNVITAGTRTSQQSAGAINIASGSPVIVNNTIVGNGASGINGAGTATIVNNIIAYNYGAITEPALARLAGTVRANCIYGNIPVGKSTFAVPVDPATNINIDPKFAVYAYGNLHIAADSPCRDKGDDSLVPLSATDIDLQPRIQGAHVDIGADESDGRTWTFTPAIVRVAPNGNDANDGSTWALAKKTLPAAIALAAAQGGDVWVQFATSVVPRDPIQLPPYCYLYGGFAGTETALGQRDWNANPTFVSGPAPSLIISTGGYRCSAIDGFVFSGATNYALGCIGASPFIHNNVFMRNSGQCVSCSFGNPLLTNNAVYANSAANTESGAVSCTYGGVTVTGNAFVANGSGTTAGGPAIYCGTYGICAVTNNLFDSNNGTTSTQTATVYMISGTGVIANNTFVNTRGTALAAGVGSTVVNNVFAFNDTGLYDTVVSSSPPAVRANCFYGNGKDYASTDFTGKYANIKAYPSFTDLFNGDYRLLAASPCVDAGDDSVVSPGETDLDGNSRIRGRHVDIGCYESSAASMTVRWSDVARALKIAGGLLASTTDDVTLLSSPPGEVDLVGAVAIDRHLSGK